MPAFDLGESQFVCLALTHRIGDLSMGAQLDRGQRDDRHAEKGEDEQHFDAAEPPASNDGVGDGTMVVEFADCSAGMVTYEIPSLGLSGEIPIQRIVEDNVPLCEALASE